MNKVLFVVLFFFFFSSCRTSRKIVYMQDVVVNTPENIAVNPGIIIQPKDMLSIIVSCKNPELSTMFNLPVVSYQAGSEIGANVGQQRLLGYVVDDEGNIDFPVLGRLNVAGLTRWELQEKIKQKLITEDLIKDLVVTIQFMNFRISVLGEVYAPGTYNIEGDKVTLLEALSLAKDLTIYGKRDGVMVIREMNGVRVTYNIDLRSADLFRSPVYYLKQNDIIYVVPNSVRAGQSTINENNVKSVSLWMSVASFLTTLSVLIFK